MLWSDWCEIHTLMRRPYWCEIHTQMRRSGCCEIHTQMLRSDWCEQHTTRYANIEFFLNYNNLKLWVSWQESNSSKFDFALKSSLPLLRWAPLKACCKETESKRHIPSYLFENLAFVFYHYPHSASLLHQIYNLFWIKCCLGYHLQPRAYNATDLPRRCSLGQLWHLVRV